MGYAGVSIDASELWFAISIGNNMAKAETVNKESLEKQLWKAADKLCKNIDAAEYKHVVLGLIFLKYISDSLEEFFPNNLGDLMDLIGNIALGDLDAAMVSVPSTEELCAMSEKMTPFLDKQIAITKKRKTLEKLRDILAPKMMSGEIRVTL
jgi:type I restriction-modification system DNA methylase subunit